MQDSLASHFSVLVDQCPGHFCPILVTIGLLNRSWHWPCVQSIDAGVGRVPIPPGFAYLGGHCWATFSNSSRLFHTGLGILLSQEDSLTGNAEPLGMTVDSLTWSLSQGAGLARDEERGAVTSQAGCGGGHKITALWGWAAGHHRNAPMGEGEGCRVSPETHRTSGTCLPA